MALRHRAESPTYDGPRECPASVFGAGEAGGFQSHTRTVDWRGHERRMGRDGGGIPQLFWRGNGELSREAIWRKKSKFRPFRCGSEQARREPGLNRGEW